MLPPPAALGVAPPAPTSVAPPPALTAPPPAPELRVAPAAAWRLGALDGTTGTLGDSQCYLGVDAKVEAIQTLNQPNAAPPGNAPSGVVGGILSALNVSFRDVKYAVPFFVQMGLFLTPVIYPIKENSSGGCSGRRSAVLTMEAGRPFGRDPI